MRVTRVEDKLVVWSQRTGVSTYDFDLGLHFSCSHPHRFEGEEMCVLRVGPIADYPAEFAEKRRLGLKLVNSPEEHTLASELESWYPVIEDLTPRTRVFEVLPPAEEVEREFGWPIFLKGSRQTSRHNPDLSVVRDHRHYEQVAVRYQDDPILHWQKAAVREFVPLEGLAGSVPGKVPPSVEYRSFWWKGECVGWGRYWYQVPTYESADVEQGLAVAREAAGRLAVTFLVVDFAKTKDGRWMVIECNDAQEAGYVGIPPREIWSKILGLIEA